jgi:hypothetical protein
MRLFLSSAILLFCSSAYSQLLFMPRDIQAAYKNGTRSMDGKPGKTYWQNRADYSINITALPPERTVKGAETITYFNNSPDTLKSLSIKLFLNIHKPGAPRNFGAEEDYLTKGVSIDAVSAGGEKMEWRENNFFPTVQQLRLKKPLAPGVSMQFSFDWHFDLSKQSNREGMIDSTTLFLAYFYPRIAVYDDYNGWDRISFMDSHEFYSDFNDYDVTINVPKNYIVWGTGTLQNPEKVLQPEYLKRFNQSLTSDGIISIATKEDVLSKKVTAQNEMNSWRFKAADIPDMVFGASDHYVWDGSSVVVDAITKRRASAQAAYNDGAKDFHYMVQFVKHSLQWFSNNWPGISYPYEKSTVFQGFADMEYPMMVNDNTTEDTVFSRFVAEHEIAHTYFPFYMGINESRYGFMDEGWATALEFLIGQADLGKEKAEGFFKQFRVNGWINDKSSDEQIPIITPGDALTGGGFGNNEYGKAALGYIAAKDLLGDELFKKCLQEYMRRWNGKHPTPWDFFYTFNNASGKNLNWFWSNWFFSSSYIDLAIRNTVKTGKLYKIVIDNIGGMAAPVDVILNYKDGTKESIHQTPSIWEKNQQQAVVTVTAKKDVESISLEGGIFMDANTEDNSRKVK